MKLTRRSFLKTMAATLDISHVPSVFSEIKGVPEPEWIIDEFDWGAQTGVAAQWIVNGEKIRNAYLFQSLDIGDRQKQLMIAYSKQALRQWYLERGHKIKRAA